MHRQGSLNVVLIAVVGGLASILVLGIGIQGLSSFQPGETAEHQEAGSAFENFVTDIEGVCRGVGNTGEVASLGTYNFQNIQRVTVSFPTVQAFGEDFNFQRDLNQCQGLEFCAAGDISDCGTSLTGGEEVQLNYQQPRANHMKVFPRASTGDGSGDSVCYGPPSNDQQSVLPGCHKVESDLCRTLDSCSYSGGTGTGSGCFPDDSGPGVCEELNEELSGDELYNTCLGIDCNWGTPDDGGG